MNFFIRVSTILAVSIQVSAAWKLGDTMDHIHCNDQSMYADITPMSSFGLMYQDDDTSPFVYMGAYTSPLYSYAYNRADQLSCYDQSRSRRDQYMLSTNYDVTAQKHSYKIEKVFTANDPELIFIGMRLGIGLPAVRGGYNTGSGRVVNVDKWKSFEVMFYADLSNSVCPAGLVEIKFIDILSLGNTTKISPPHQSGLCVDAISSVPSMPNMSFNVIDYASTGSYGLTHVALHYYQDVPASGDKNEIVILEYNPEKSSLSMIAKLEGSKFFAEEVSEVRFVPQSTKLVIAYGDDTLNLVDYTDSQLTVKTLYTPTFSGASTMQLSRPFYRALGKSLWFNYNYKLNTYELFYLTRDKDFRPVLVSSAL